MVNYGCCRCGGMQYRMSEHEGNIYCDHCLSVVKHPYWPRGKLNGRRIAGLSIKFTVDVSDFRWIPLLSWTKYCRLISWLCFSIRPDTVYADD